MSACTTLNATSDAKGSANNPFKMTQGITFRLTNRVFKSVADGGGPFVLTGFTGRSQMRDEAEGVGTPLAEFTVTISGTETGVAEIKLLPADNVGIAPGLYVFDIEYIETADPTNIVPGTDGVQYIRVFAGVTKP